MKRARRLAARLGLDANPLRRRTDKIAAYGKAALLALFIIGTPAAGAVAGHWGYRAAMATEHSQQSWHQVTAVILRTPPARAAFDGGSAWTRASWTAPAGHRHTATIPVATGVNAGRRVPIWVNASGRWSGPPLTRDDALAYVAIEVVATPVLLAVALSVLALGGRWLLDRRRIDAWGAAWASVGPVWTRQFRATGKLPAAPAVARAAGTADNG